MLTTSGPGGSWSSETVWSLDGGGSGGGIKLDVCDTEHWQEGINMAYNGGSTNMRNLPDVALTAHNLYFVCLNGQAGTGDGTSALITALGRIYCLD